MKKKKLISLALIGISLGVLSSAAGQNQKEKMSPEMLTFYEQLEPEAQQKFLELDPEHRKAAMQIIEEHSCRAPSDCHGHREKAVEEQYNNQMQQRKQTSNKF